MINKIPLELEPPSPMPTPPLRRRPSPTPQLSFTHREDLPIKLYIDKRWN